MTATGWTLDELTARVAAALGGAAYAGAPNGRVRDVPDARAIRWYATIGLVDRPVMRGRVALYGPRHLLQLVAIKRLQSRGKRIADIQVELADVPDEVLGAIADVPEGLAALPGGPPGGAPSVTHLGNPDKSGISMDVAAGGDGTGDRADAAGGPAATGKGRRRFWTDSPGSHHPPAAGPPVRRPAPPAPGVRPPESGPGLPGLLTGVPLPGGAVLLLPAHPGADDVAAIRAAAQPLLDLLTSRGILPGGPADQSTTPNSGSAK
ncbi:MerR family transcriptional regulator [Dactylosporangium roseum]|uniref:MerR family transcriptional regulator n=1 Tax=Dactylosporangium roseum TaxID=47989 RepID=A0ABY5YYZ4_9ACTN|nr:helix-turn-helix domain-containing protein [Dactylosporangium roseum]UWZ34989.1 MerR family transcriptional regulator [Dactylosporangium roseum]